MSAPWLSILGIGEDGIDGLAAPARALLSQARFVIGGARHLRLAAPLITGEAAVWPQPFSGGMAEIAAHRPGPVVVLASGDPFCYGVGSSIARHFAAGEWRCLPAPSCLSLACAALGWALQTVESISLCGRPIEPLAALLRPGRQILALSEDAETPGNVARFLCAHGFGASEIVLLEALGGPEQRIRRGTAEGFDLADAHSLNLLAITLVADAGIASLPLASGLPDDAFAHDGQLTKREIRAVTLSALAPRAGELLWDIGTGSGSIAIEWLRLHPSLRAIAIERRTDRLARAIENAQRLGVPHLQTVEGAAPAVLEGLPAPDAIFIGGGTQAAGVIDAAWSALRAGGRMVVNSVTIETDIALFAANRRLGGTLTRIGVERLTDIGGLHGFRPAMTITQWTASKP
jgi:precorrin-6Y C5,15-methyltransferase (decarboxylating)